MVNYNNTPVLSKITIGNETYWLKDADARALLDVVKGDVDVIKADYLKAADKTELSNLINDEKVRALAAEAQVLVDSKAYTDEKIGQIILMKYEAVAELPTADAAHEFNKSKTIYLKSESGSGKEKDVYGEYICIKVGSNYQWEKIGDTRIDFSNYYTKSEIDSKVTTLQNAISAEADRAIAVEEGLNNDIEVVAGDLQAEVTRATDIESGLNTRLGTAETKLAGIESGAQVNKIEHIKLNGSDLTIDSDKRIDLGSIATSTEIERIEGLIEAEEERAKGEEARIEGKVDTLEDSLGALAYKDSATGTVAGQTISGVKATGSLSGSASVVLGFDSTALESSGTYKPEGSVGVTVTGGSFNKITGIGTLPSYTDGSLTGGKATVVDTTKFNGGTQANFVQGSKANLVYEESDSFAKEGIKAIVGGAPGDEDHPLAECLYIESVATGKASKITQWETNGNDTFTKNTVASLGAGFVTAGTDAVYNPGIFNAGSLPTMEAHTVDASASFTGTQKAVEVSGNYDKAKVNSATISINDANLAVGDITVAAKDVTVE